MKASNNFPPIKNPLLGVHSVNLNEYDRCCPDTKQKRSVEQTTKLSFGRRLSQTFSSAKKWVERFFATGCFYSESQFASLLKKEITQYQSKVDSIPSDSKPEIPNQLTERIHRIQAAVRNRMTQVNSHDQPLETIITLGDDVITRLSTGSSQSTPHLKRSTRSPDLNKIPVSSKDKSSSKEIKLKRQKREFELNVIAKFKTVAAIGGSQSPPTPSTREQIYPKLNAYLAKIPNKKLQVLASDSTFGIAIEYYPEIIAQALNAEQLGVIAQVRSGGTDRGESMCKLIGKLENDKTLFKKLMTISDFTTAHTQQAIAMKMSALKSKEREAITENCNSAEIRSKVASSIQTDLETNRKLLTQTAVLGNRSKKKNIKKRFQELEKLQKQLPPKRVTLKQAEKIVAQAKKLHIETESDIKEFPLEIISSDQPKPSPWQIRQQQRNAVEQERLRLKKIQSEEKAAAKKTALAALRPEEILANLLGPLDTFEIGEPSVTTSIYDQLDQLTVTGAFNQTELSKQQLEALWRCESKMIYSESDIERRKNRLSIILPTLSSQQLKGSMAMTGFRSLISDTVNGYAEVAVASLQADQIQILTASINGDAEVIRALGDMLSRLELDEHAAGKLQAFVDGLQNHDSASADFLHNLQLVKGVFEQKCGLLATRGLIDKERKSALINAFATLIQTYFTPERE